MTAAKPTTPSGHAAKPHTALLRRWLTAIALLGPAEELAARNDDVSGAAALVAADAACETLLGILASLSLAHESKDGDKFRALIRRASEAMDGSGLSMPPGLLADLWLDALQRNAVVHDGATSPPQQAALACANARQLLDLLPAVSAHFKALPSSAGIAHAVAALVNAPELASLLVESEDRLHEGDAGGAADAIAEARTHVLYRLDPPLTGRHRRFTSGLRVDQQQREVIEAIEGLREGQSRIQGWVIALALGVHPTTYRRLVDTVGENLPTMGSMRNVLRARPPALDDARWAVSEMAGMVFRLWLAGALMEGTSNEVFARRAHEGSL